MADLSGKKAVIMGVANGHSIASSIAKQLHAAGVELYFSHLPDPEGGPKKMEQRVRRVTDDLDAKLVAPCDVSSDESIAEFFKKVEEKAGKIDFLVHSIAFANLEDIRCPVIDCSREGFKMAMDISAYSLIATCRSAEKIMNDHGSVVTLSYFGGERVVPGYNMMGICKAGLEMSAKYLAFDLGKRGIRLNIVSAGPIKTLAASAIGDFSKMIGYYKDASPLGKTATADNVASTCCYLLSDDSASITGEIIHIDGGYHIMGAPKSYD